MTPQEVIELFMGMLSQIKLFHWCTMSFSTHKALDELHEGVSGKVDRFVETFVGLTRAQPMRVFTIKTTATSNIRKIDEFLQTCHKNISEIRPDFASHSELQNILDDMLSDIGQAMYLCKLT